jgi:hypothetical protein
MDMARKSALLGLLLAASGSAHAYDLMALWESRNVGVTDTFYSTYYNDHLSSTHVSGFADHGVTAWLPCSLNTATGPFGETPYFGSTSYPDVPPGDTITPSRFGHGYSARMNFACNPPSGAVPLYRLYKSTPETDHVYTTSSSEVSALEARGYAFERVEGYLFTSQVTGSSPLYRLRKGNNVAGQDAEHRYTLSTSARQSLLTAGWTDEGVIGYAFSSYINPSVSTVGFTGTLNGTNINPTTPVTVPIRNVVPFTGLTTLGGNSTTSIYGMYASNVTVRPAGAVWQNFTFSIYTGNWFPATPSTSPLDHMPMYLHFASQATANGIPILPPYDGIGLTFVPGHTLNGTTCSSVPHSGGQLMLEIGMGMSISCDTVLATPMQNATWYDVSYSIDDTAQVRISIKNQATGVALTFANGQTTFSGSVASVYSCPFAPPFGSLSANNSFCANPYSVFGFPSSNTGYMIFPQMRSTDISAKFSNLKAQWLNSSFVPL